MESNGLLILTGLSGFIWITEEDVEFKYRNFTFLDLEISAARGSFRPSLKFGLPLNNGYATLTDYSIGLEFAYALDNI